MALINEFLIIGTSDDDDDSYIDALHLFEEFKQLGITLFVNNSLNDASIRHFFSRVDLLQFENFNHIVNSMASRQLLSKLDAASSSSSDSLELNKIVEVNTTRELLEAIEKVQ